jgi:GH15 family glucan-1,4-alpha-glucosidase
LPDRAGIMTRRESHPRISDYGLIGNRHTCALVDRDGSIDWCCLPHLDDASVFGALLDLRRGGHWRIAPAGRRTSTRAYAGSSPVLTTEFHADGGVLRLTDFLPIRRGRGNEISVSAHSIIRLVECIQGEVEVDVDWTPRPNYGRDDVSLTREGDCVIARSAGMQLWLRGLPPETIELADAAARARPRLRGGERLSLICGMGEPDGQPLALTAERLLRETLGWWEEWSQRCRLTPGAEIWDGLTIRSGMVLKLLSNEQSGAIAAAPTTSLPEDIGGVRNWDYRFCWVRDASMISQALTVLGQKDEGIAFLEFLERAAQQHNDPARVQVLYGLSGETHLDEYNLGHLDGYRDSRPVRVGNAAALQRQLDVYGELLAAAHDLVRLGVGLTEGQRTWLKGVADYVCRVWRWKDRGIWEVRGPEQHFTYSKLMCWVALDRAIALAPVCGWTSGVDTWRTERSAIRAAILEQGFDADRNTFVQSFGGRSLDASNLLIPRMGFLPPRDPRVLGTIDATLRDLTENGLVHRYRVDDTEDGVSGCEGAFGICTFWLSDALALAGRVEAARDIFVGMAGRANDLGLFPEEIDPSTGEFLGNYPQAFTHVGLINSAFCLGQALSGGTDDPAEPPVSPAAIIGGPDDPPG